MSLAEVRLVNLFDRRSTEAVEMVDREAGFRIAKLRMVKSGRGTLTASSLQHRTFIPSVQEYRRAVFLARHYLYCTSMMLKTTSPIKSTWPFMQTTPRCILLSGPPTPYQTHTGLSRAHLSIWRSGGKSGECPLSQRNRN